MGDLGATQQQILEILSAEPAVRPRGYQATAGRKGTPLLPVIEAHNCVFHPLARERNEVCHFDLALLGRLTGAGVAHDECIVRGGAVCRFRFTATGGEG